MLHAYVQRESHKFRGENFWKLNSPFVLSCHRGVPALLAAAWPAAWLQKLRLAGRRPRAVVQARAAGRDARFFFLPILNKR